MFPVSIGVFQKFTRLGALTLAFGVGSTLAFGAPASAAIVLNGVKNGDDTYTNSFTANWFNGHKRQFSIYDGTDETEVFWEAVGDDLFLYLEAPLYVKNMIWGNGVTEADRLDYLTQWDTHHDETEAKPFKMDFGTATGSEKVIFGTVKTTADKGGFFNLEGNTFDLKKSLDPLIVNYKTSLSYLLSTEYQNNQFAGLCDVTNCFAAAVAMSFEIKFTLSAQDKADLGNGQLTTLLTNIQTNGLEFHLSPERGLLPTVIPLPAALPLYGTGLAVMGLIGWRKRRKAAALA